ncbi:MAG TPA: Pls/PosA family non-ribosomal peptide synthetase, partial [Opitutales bacterium]|nr:Pls/PosA family non-ribosomal peptide synthetase [Opitutales bacterium]
GTTGKPKGVLITHRAIRHFVATEGAIMGITEKDVVAQSASLSFDLSLEEIWLSFAAGATLQVVNKEMLQLGAELGRALAREKVTVWSCVPTLLALQEGDMPGLRLIIVGGEACPPDLVRRWARPGRRMVNTYGPTETTVTATWCDLVPGKSVTIGRPLPNYTTYVLDESLRPVTPGESGELCIGGPGVATGYLNRPQLTAEKFIPNPFARPGAPDPVLYRSGDLVRVNVEGNIEFLGRIDSQVKIRGYRIELSEIEAVLLDVGKLRQVAVAVHSAQSGADPQIVAYLVPREGDKPDISDLRDKCRARLPAYMVPAIFQVQAGLPVLPSGKIDRKNLPTPFVIPSSAASPERKSAAPEKGVERMLHEIWIGLFAPTSVSVDDDFFLDLGGHSLRAAALVSKLRALPEFAHVSMRDIYAHPTIRKLAAHLSATSPRGAKGAAAGAFQSVPWWRYGLCTFAQGLALVPIFALYSIQLLIPYMTYAVITSSDYDWLPENPWQARFFAIVASLAVFLATIPAIFLLSIILKWLVLGRTKPGVYPLWGFYYFRWWFTLRLLGVVPTDYLTGTPLLAIYLRLLGAKIGPGVHLDTDSFDAPDLLDIGEGSSICTGAALLCSRIENGLLKIAATTVGRGCHVGNGSVVAAGSVLRDRAHLGDLSLLPSGGIIPANEMWCGSPAAKVGIVPPAPPLAPLNVRIAHGLVFAALFFIFPLLSIAPIFPGMILLTEIDQMTSGYDWLLLSPLLALVFIAGTCLEIATLKWLVVGEVQPGKWSVYSNYYVRLWFVDKLMDLSLETVNSLYATLYLNPWFRLLGATVGVRAEISTASSVSHDLLELGDESFIADAVMLGVPSVRDGVLELGQTKIGKRAFIGNSALVPAGCAVGEEVLIGCLSVPPTDEAQATTKGSSWFGTPAIQLPRRQHTLQFDEASRFKPTRKLLSQRMIIEAVRVLLPVTVYVAMNSLMIAIVLQMHPIYGLLGVAWRFPFLDMGLAGAVALGVVLFKWLVIGRYRPVEKPLWSRYVWRSELVTSAYENIAVPLFCEHLQGTPFINWYQRLLGAKIGRRVYAETADITEHDVVSIGDDAALNMDCGIQTHLFEDRVMKISSVAIGPRCAVGAGAIVLYDSKMEADAQLDDLSMLMKGETLPSGTAWQGSPARRRAAPAGKSLVYAMPQQSKTTVAKPNAVAFPRELPESVIRRPTPVAGPK